MALRRDERGFISVFDAFIVLIILSIAGVAFTKATLSPVSVAEADVVAREQEAARTLLSAILRTDLNTSFVQPPDDVVVREATGASLLAEMHYLLTSSSPNPPLSPVDVAPISDDIMIQVEAYTRGRHAVALEVRSDDEQRPPLCLAAGAPPSLAPCERPAAWAGARAHVPAVDEPGNTLTVHLAAWRSG